MRIINKLIVHKNKSKYHFNKTWFNYKKVIINNQFIKKWNCQIQEEK